MFRRIKSKLPTGPEIFPVYSVILFMTFTWTLYVMFWTLPSWLGDMNIWGMLDLAAYILSFTFIESILLLLGMLLLVLILPARFFGERFVAQGSLLVVLLGFGAYFAQPQLADLRALRNLYLVAIPLIFLCGLILLTILLSFVFERFEKISKILTTFAERMTIFSYIYLPLGILSLVISVLKIVF